jgi:DNA-directed RNA polymerase specialized sigma subunit
MTEDKLYDHIQDLIEKEIVKKINSNSVCDADDYYQEAILSVLQGVKTYSPESGLSFLDYLEIQVLTAIKSLSFKNSHQLTYQTPTPTFLEDSSVFLKKLKHHFTNSEIRAILGGEPNALF